jgi:peptidoglycan/LPS O-acetylase OafA/YrhL
MKSNLLLAGVCLTLITSVTLAIVSAKFEIGISRTVNAACITLLVGFAVIRSNRPLWKWLEHPAVAAIGVRSYSIYLWQQLFLNPRADGFFYHFPQNIVFAIVAGWLSYRFIEQPFLALKNRQHAATRAVV